jgi:O-antigen/teichoic acid export membrane protein
MSSLPPDLPTMGGAEPNRLLTARPHRLWLNMRKRLAEGRGAAWAIAEYFGYPLLMFAATPLLLHVLGATVYGQWMLLLTLNGLGGLAGMGMGMAATREVAGHLGRADRKGAAAAARSCLGVTLAASAAIAAAIVAGAAVVPSPWLARMGEPEAIRLVVVAGAMMIVLEQVDTVFAGTIRGLERYDVSAKVELTAKAAMVLATIAAAVLTQSLAVIMATTLVCMLVRSAIKARIAARLLGNGMLWPRWEQHHVAAAFNFGKWTWGQSIGAALFATADRLLVGGMMGAAALAHYSVCVQLAQQVQTLPAAGAQVLLPRVSRLEGEGRPYRNMALRLTVGVGAIAGLAGLVLALLGYGIMQLWVGTSIAQDTAGTLPLLALGYAILGANVVPHYVLLGAGRARFVAVVNIAAGLFAIALAWLLIPAMGFAGAAIGRLCYALIISANVLAMLHQTRHSKIHGDELARDS